MARGRASISALFVSIVAVECIRSQDNLSVTALVGASIRISRRAAGAHPALFNIAVAVAAVTALVVSVITAIVAEIQAIAADLKAATGSSITVALPAKLNFASLAATVALLGVTIVAALSTLYDTISTDTVVVIVALVVAFSFALAVALG